MNTTAPVHPSGKAMKIPTEVRADSAGRIGLGKTAKGKLFQTHHQDDGSILLVPAVVIPEQEAWFFRKPERVAALDRSMAQAERKETTVITLDELIDL